MHNDNPEAGPGAPRPWRLREAAGVPHWLLVATGLIALVIPSLAYLAGAA
jgi:hypothetical protein